MPETKQDRFKDVKLSQLPIHPQGLIAEFVMGKSSAMSLKKMITSPSAFFGTLVQAGMLKERVEKILHSLVHRINVNETLALLQKHPYFLQTFPFLLTVKSRSGQAISRHSIIGVLDALDEWDIIEEETKAESKAETKAESKAESKAKKQHALIPTLLAMFDNPDPKHKHRYVYNQLLLQVDEASSKEHQDETEKRHKRYMSNIKDFILKVIESKEIINDNYTESLGKLMNRPFVRTFIQTAFQPEAGDNAELGVILDVWQVYHDYLYDLLNQHIDKQDMIKGTVRKDPSQPILGGIWDRKVTVVDDAVWRALHRFGQFCHVEVFAVGAAKVARGEVCPVRFDARSKVTAGLLSGVGDRHFFDFFSGSKYDREALARGGTVQKGRWEARGPAYAEIFYLTKTVTKLRILNEFFAAKTRILNEFLNAIHVNRKLEAKGDTAFITTTLKLPLSTDHVATQRSPKTSATNLTVNDSSSISTIAELESKEPLPLTKNKDKKENAASELEQEDPESIQHRHFSSWPASSEEFDEEDVLRDDFLSQHTVKLSDDESMLLPDKPDQNSSDSKEGGISSIEELLAAPTSVIGKRKRA